MVSLRRSVRPGVLRYGALGLGLLALMPGLFSEKGDTVLYATYAQQGWAGRHFFTEIHIEYPPFNALLFMLPELVARLSPGLGYYGAFVVMAAGADLLQRRALQRILPPRQSATLLVGVSAACAAMLFYTYLKRFDIFAAAATTWMLTRLLRKPHDVWAWVLWAMAVACKLYPVAFAPMCLVYSRRQGVSRRTLVRQVAVGGLVLAGIHAAATWYGGPAAWAWLVYMQMRGLQLTSTYAAVGMLLTGFGKVMPVAYDFGCLQVYAPWAQWCVRLSPWLTLGALSFTWRRTWRRTGTPYGLWCAAAASVAALILTSKVFSPQYVIWLVPLLSMACIGPDTPTGRIDRPLVAMTLVLCGATALLFPYEIEIARGQLFRQLMLLVRTADLMLIWAWLVARNSAYESTPATPGG